MMRLAQGGARGLATRHQYATGFVFVVSAALTVVLIACYPVYQNTPLHLTLQLPFTSWGDVRAFYKGLADKPVVTPADNLTVQVMSIAWCDHAYPRPERVSANRSSACACLYALQQAFVANSTDATYSPKACHAAGDDAVGCLRYRSTWDVWVCGSDCRLHPIVLALTCNLGLTVLSLSALLGSLRMIRYLIWGFSSVPALGGVVLLLAIWPVQNFLFVAIIVGVWVGTVLGLNIELSPQTQTHSHQVSSDCFNRPRVFDAESKAQQDAHPAAQALAQKGGSASLAWTGLAAQRTQRARRAQRAPRTTRLIGTILEEDAEQEAFCASLGAPSSDEAYDESMLPPYPIPIVTCVWFCQPLTLSVVSAYLAVAHTVRDLVGVLCFAALGYLAGLMIQRVHWARCFLVFGADGGGWPLPRHLARGVYKWVVRCLGLGLLGVWVALFTLAYTNWLGTSPYASAPVSLVLLALCLMISGCELAAALRTPALGTIGHMGWLELIQLGLLLVCHAVFAVTTVVDGAR